MRVAVEQVEQSTMLELELSRLWDKSQLNDSEDQPSSKGEPA